MTADNTPPPDENTAGPTQEVVLNADEEAMKLAGFALRWMMRPQPSSVRNWKNRFDNTPNIYKPLLYGVKVKPNA